MTANYTREQLKLSVAKMCLTIGWHTTMTTPIELLTDILCNYLSQLGKITSDYANGFGLSEASVEHLALAFKDFHVNLQDLEDFVRNVDSPEPPLVVPQYPVPREDHLNFLKPGSKEVVTRQVHVHEHLPPMFPQLEEENSTEEPIKTETEEHVDVVENADPKFKHPAELPQDIFKRPRILSDEELGRPTREISSVMMTSSGFLSPAREGRLPEARTPAIALEPSIPMAPIEHNHSKKTMKNYKMGDKFKDHKGSSHLFKPHKDSQPHKHSSQPKDVPRNQKKHRGHGHGKGSSSSIIPKNYMIVNDAKPDAIPHKKPTPENDNQAKLNKALAAARMKTEKFNTTITPIPPRVIPATIVRPEQMVDKLSTEPDKKKIDIFRKISVKTDRADKINKIKEDIKIESRGSSPDLIIDEPTTSSSHHNLPKDITIELVQPPPVSTIPPPKKSPENTNKFEKYYFDDYSPPGTPSTPRTPEMVSHSPPMTKGEKHKSKSKRKKLPKYSSPSGIDIDAVDIELERPKTPDSNLIFRPEKRRPPPNLGPMHFPFFAPFSGPGLIPAPLSNPLFSHLPIPPIGLPGFGQSPYLPPMHSSMPMNPPMSLNSPMAINSAISMNSPMSMNSSMSMDFIPSARSPVLPPISVPSVSPATPTPAQAPAPPAPIPLSSSTVTSTVTKDNDEPQPCCSTSLDRGEPLSSRYSDNNTPSTSSNTDWKNKEHKKDKKDKLKKKNKKDKHKSDKKKSKEEKKEKSRTKKEKKEKKKNKESQDGSTSPVPKLTLKLPPKTKLNIKAIVKQEDRPEPEPQPSTSTAPEPQREMSPELARFSALVTGQPKPRTHTAVSSTTREEEVVPQAGPSRRPGRPRIHPIRTMPAVPGNRRNRTSSEDSEGNKVWICPGCGVQDDGSPMIACDECDAWYHWVCVGIQVDPGNNEDWYCRHCIGRNLLKREKKKKRKGKGKGKGGGHKH